tara:strand:- start:14610 stop:16088 length:1479 start_codon:yes stop_codon:yes gene_type:complete
MTVKFYNTILNNFKKKDIFYKYYKTSKSYNEFYQFINNIVYFLLKKNKKKRGVVVTYSNKSAEMYASVFPILISDFVWIPVSPEMPATRVEQILNLTKPDFFFYDTRNNDVFNKIKKKKIKMINFNFFHKNNFERINLLSVIKKLDFNKTATIFFSSGSTGVPKGVKITHKNFITDVYLQKKHLYKNKTKSLIVGDYNDPSFSTFFDIYFPVVLFGSTICPAISRSDKFLMYDHYIKNKINTAVLVPSALERIKEILIRDKIKLTGKFLFMCGEPFFLKLYKFIIENLKFKNVFNSYGSVEMGNWVFYHECNKKDLIKFKKLNMVPIGRPYSQVKYKIKNKELIIESPTITDGYLSDDQTKINFKIRKNKDNIFFSGDKSLKFKNKIFVTGRKDKMVKINGYRIQIEDIEFEVRKIKTIKNVVVFEKKLSNNRNYLVMVVFTEKNFSRELFYELLKKNLPTYMIPKKIHFEVKIPQNINGKIDKKLIKETYK